MDIAEDFCDDFGEFFSVIWRFCIVFYHEVSIYRCLYVQLLLANILNERILVCCICQCAVQAVQPGCGGKGVS